MGSTWGGSWGVDLCPWLNSTGTMPMGGLAQGPNGPLRGDAAARRPMAPGREINGYPFTTFTDFSDFLGIILGVLSDDLATMSILLLDYRPISGRNTDFTDFY